jgi:F-type H+-transporting ATPase subunit alpha
VAVLFAVTNGYADKVAVEQISNWVTALIRNLETSRPELLADITEKKLISDETRSKLETAIGDFARTWQA